MQLTIKKLNRYIPIALKMGMKYKIFSTMHNHYSYSSILLEETLDYFTEAKKGLDTQYDMISLHYRLFTLQIIKGIVIRSGEILLNVIFDETLNRDVLWVNNRYFETHRTHRTWIQLFAEVYNIPKEYIIKKGTSACNEFLGRPIKVDIEDYSDIAMKKISDGFLNNHKWKQPNLQL